MKFKNIFTLLFLVVFACNFRGQQIFDCKLIDGDTLYKRISNKISEPNGKLPFLGYLNKDSYLQCEDCAYTYKRCLMLNGISKMINPSSDVRNLYLMAVGIEYSEEGYYSTNKKSLLNLFSNKLYRNILYTWAVPHLKEAFANISYQKQQWLYNDFLQAEKYLATFDLKKERAALKQIEEVEGNSFRDEKGDFNAFVFRRINNNDISLADLKELFAKIKKDFIPLLKSKDSFCSSVTSAIAIDSAFGAIELDTAFMIYNTTTLKILSDEKYKKAKRIDNYSHTNGYYLIQDFKNKYAIFSREKGFLTPFQYDEVTSLYDKSGYVLLCKSKKGIEYLDFDGKPQKLSNKNTATIGTPKCYSLQQKDSLTYDFLQKNAVYKADTTFYEKLEENKYVYYDTYGNMIYTDSSYKVNHRYGYEVRTTGGYNYEEERNGNVWRNTWYEVPRTYQLYLRSKINATNEPTYEYVSNDNQAYDFYWLCDSTNKIVCNTPIAGKSNSTEVVDENGNMFYQMIFPQNAPDCEKDSVYIFDFLMFNKGVADEYKGLFSLKDNKLVTSAQKISGTSNYYFNEFFYSIKDKKYKAAYQIDTIINIKFDDAELNKYIKENREYINNNDLADLANPIKTYSAVKFAIGDGSNVLVKESVYKIIRRTIDYGSNGDYLMLKNGNYSNSYFVYNEKLMQLNEVLYSFPLEKTVIPKGCDSIKEKFILNENYATVASYFIEYKGKKQTVYNETGKQLATVSLNKVKIVPENIFVIGENIYCITAKKDSVTLPLFDGEGTRTLFIENCELINLKNNEVVLTNIIKADNSKPEDIYEFTSYFTEPSLTSIQKYRSYLFFMENDANHIVFNACNEKGILNRTGLYSIKNGKYTIPLDTSMNVSLRLPNNDDSYYSRSSLVYKTCVVEKNGSSALFGTDGKQLTEFKYRSLYRNGLKDEFTIEDEEKVDMEGNSILIPGGNLYFKNGKLVEQRNNN